MTDLRKAAQAVLDRWDSPKWEGSIQGPTADLMADLRRELDATEDRRGLVIELDALKLAHQKLTAERDQLAGHLALYTCPESVDARQERPPQEAKQVIKALREYSIWAGKPGVLEAAADLLEVQQEQAGWQLVPVEPTQAMIDAVFTPDDFTPGRAGDWKIRERWSAMLAAAPKGEKP